ncbi:hypothetical protein IL306_004714 [Fusarium sp. DS 682]|nr:hypothetical protein IL306_004714 [Fusarium sp. DS 682]
MNPLGTAQTMFCNFKFTQLVETAMPDNCYPPFSVLSEVVREFDPTTPPADPLDLLSTVSSVFHQRKERLHQETLARRDAEIEAKYVAIREARRKKELEEEVDGEQETSDEEWDSEEQDDEEWDEYEHEYEDPSKKEIEALVEYEIAKESRGSGLKPARGETQEGYRKRMRGLEKRIKKLQLFESELERVQREPLRYVEGFPVNLVNVFYHILPHLPVMRTEKFDCLQCKVKGRRCSRSQNYSPVCERCRRHGDPCLVKDMTYPVALCWWFAKGQTIGDIEKVEIEWLERLVNNRDEAIQALPVWPEVDDNSSKSRGEENTPRRWQDFLTERTKVNIKRVK